MTGKECEEVMMDTTLETKAGFCPATLAASGKPSRGGDDFGWLA
jgi:hypothetical protein